MSAIHLHRFRDAAGLAITGTEGGQLYLDAKAARALAKAAAALARDLERRDFQESTFPAQEIGGRREY